MSTCRRQRLAQVLQQCPVAPQAHALGRGHRGDLIAELGDRRPARQQALQTAVGQRIGTDAILQYAADKAGRDSAYPRDLQQRADVNRWLLWESSSWFPSAYVFLVENCVKPLLGSQPDPAVLDAQAAQFHKLAGILDARLAGSRWVCGDHPTIADIALAAPIHLHAWQKLPLSDHPNLQRWMTQQVEPMPCWKKTHVGEGFTLNPSAQ